MLITIQLIQVLIKLFKVENFVKKHVDIKINIKYLLWHRYLNDKKNNVKTTNNPDMNLIWKHRMLRNRFQNYINYLISIGTYLIINCR